MIPPFPQYTFSNWYEIPFLAQKEISGIIMSERSPQ